MTSEWKTEPLKGMVSYIAKGIPPAYVEVEGDNTVRVLNQKCNRDFVISYTESRLHDLSKRSVPKEKYLRDEDILINSTGTGTAGRIAQLNVVHRPTIVDGHMIVLRGNEKVVPRYLGYALKAQQATVLQLDEGSTGQTELNRDRLLSEIEISYPVSLDEQEAIADTLAALDARIAENKAINHHLEQMAQAIFKSWFMEFEPSIPFTKIVQVLGGGTPRTGTAEYWNGDIPFFTPKDALGTTYTLNTEKSLTVAGLSNCSSRLYPINTVFVTARGTVGKLSLAGCPMAMNQSCYALVGIEGYGQHFVYHLAQFVVDSLKHKASGAVFDAIITKDFESEIVPDIAAEDARSFEDKVIHIYKAILNHSNENLRLASLRDTLLPRLMSGELSVVGPNEAK